MKKVSFDLMLPFPHSPAASPTLRPTEGRAAASPEAARALDVG
ncbi:hypothetical protein [Sorangium sp. So ce1024]